MKPLKLVLATTIVTIWLTAGCTNENTSGNELLIAAASSTRPLMEQVAPLLETRLGISVKVSYGASEGIAHKIRQGAPFDIFISAQHEILNDLAAESFVMPGSITPFAYGRLVLVHRTRSHSTMGWEDAVNSKNTKYIAIANPELAPYGAASKEAMAAAGLPMLNDPQIVFGENVHQSLQLVISGNADVGFTAKSLAVAYLPTEFQVSMIPRAQHPNSSLMQSVGIVTTSRFIEHGEEVVNFLSGSDLHPSLSEFGYLPADRTARTGK